MLCCNYRGLKELTIRIAWNVKDLHQGNLYQRSKFELSLDSWLDKWVTKGFQPQVLKIVVGRDISLTTLVEHWLQLNPRSPTGNTGCLKVFSSLEVPMDPFPTLPDFQLQFGLLCTMPLVKPSECGLLGIEERDILLTDSTYGGKVSRKAKMIRLSDDIRSNHFSTDITGLSLVTQFDASSCGYLCSGHLEQLAMAFPNLQQLNLLGNSSCLNKLQGLHVIASSCKNLQALNLLCISVLSIESHVELWKILVEMSLTCLAIDLCVLIPCEKNEREIISLFQKCLNLKALELRKHSCCNCGDYTTNYYHTNGLNLAVLSNFTSLTNCFVSNTPYVTEVIINSCSMLKYFTHLSCINLPLRLSTPNQNLEQLCIKVFIPNDARIPATFLQSVSAHGGLVHVVLYVGELYADDITALIENSPKLLTFTFMQTESIKTLILLDALH